MTQKFIDFSCDGNSNVRRRGKFRLDQVVAFEILDEYVCIYIPGANIISDRNPELEEILNNINEL